jgi:hypothetical protein
MLESAQKGNEETKTVNSASKEFTTWRWWEAGWCWAILVEERDGESKKECPQVACPVL